MVSPTSAHSRIGLIVVYAVVFGLFLDSQSLAPLIAPYAVSLGASVALAGLIGGAYSAINLLGNLGAGYWSDRIGRKLPVVAGLAIAGVALLLYPLAAEPYLLLGLQMMHGLGAALVSPACLAYIGDRTAATGRGRAMALYGVAAGVAGLVGPPLAGLLRDQWGYSSVFWLLAATILMLVLPASRLITESFPTKAVRVEGSVRRVLHNRRLLLAYASAFCWMLGLGTLLVFLPLMGQAWGFTSARIGLLFASFALAATIIQASPLGRLSDRWGREATIMFALVLVALALVLLSFLNQWATLMAGMFVYGIGFGFLFPAMSALIADETELQTRGTASGIFTAAFSLGVIVGMGSAGGLVWLQQTAHIHPFQFVALIVLLGVAWAGVVLLTRTQR